jgi:phage tail protein X
MTATRRIAASREGMMLDRMTQEAGGQDAEAVAALALNPGLAGRLAAGGHVMRPGEAIAVPEIMTAPARLATVKLWD